MYPKSNRFVISLSSKKNYFALAQLRLHFYDQSGATEIEFVAETKIPKIVHSKEEQELRKLVWILVGSVSRNISVYRILLVAMEISDTYLLTRHQTRELTERGGRLRCFTVLAIRLIWIMDIEKSLLRICECAMWCTMWEPLISHPSIFLSSPIVQIYRHVNDSNAADHTKHITILLLPTSACACIKISQRDNKLPS